jgi:hypothetical protein
VQGAGGRAAGRSFREGQSCVAAPDDAPISSAAVGRRLQHGVIAGFAKHVRRPSAEE